MITITKVAIDKIKEFAEAEGIGHTSIRLKVIGGGCAGMTNDMTFNDKINEMDEVFETDDVKIIVDPLSMQYLEGTEIDYVDRQYDSGFKFINPNVKGSCGCQKSFSY